jgi:hypothetical protein
MHQSTTFIDRLNRSGKLLLICILSMSLMVTSGCGGCRKSPQQAKNAKTKKEEEEKKKAKKKKPYQSKRPYVVPTDDDDNGTQLNSLKPGHWTTVTQQMIANEKDTQVEIQSSVVDQFDRGVRIDNTNYELVSSRAAAMPKERIREFESLFYIPRGTRPALRTRVIDRRSGATILESRRVGSPMPAFQYYLVVLSAEPDRLKYIKSLASIESVAMHEDGGRRVLYNRVSFLQPKAKSLPLPSHALTWTSISTLVWDKLDPSRVSPSQQDAMIDWLHWGGRLIVNGPGSMERLRGSFLEPFLPASRDEAIELTEDSIAEFNETWSVPTVKGKATITLKTGQVMVGVKLLLEGNGYFVKDMGELVAEGQVGRGSIVVTSFSLADRAILNWPSLDSFFNGCLLRRPGREFDDSFRSIGTESRVASTLSNQDPRMVSNLRYFSRDTPKYGQSGNVQSRWATDPASGVAGWNDRSGTAEAARSALKDAAGITIPKVGFVLRTLAAYLAIIVPVNWLFFRLIGRVEWAWVAAPVIAIGGSLAVVRLAELDIGFARSRTEVATLEIQGGHTRGHLARYNALYTSLAAKYSMAIDEDDALAQPFPTGKDYEPGAYDTIHKVRLRRGRTIEMDGFHVASNSTSMVHSEQMLDLGGPFELTGDEAKGWKLKNDSKYRVNDVGLIRNGPNSLEASWLGELRSGQSKPVQFTPIESVQWLLPQWSEVATFGRARRDDGELRLRSLWSLAVQRLKLDDSEVRMIGWSDVDLKGLEFEPAASQTRTQTLVVAHFWTGQLTRPGIDTNLPPEMDLDKVEVLRDRDLLRQPGIAPPNGGSGAPPNPGPPNPGPP